MTDVKDLRGLDLLDAAIEHIERNPETWVQSDYRCRTGMCLAGWIATLAGGEWATSLEHAWGEWMLAEPGDTRRVARGTDYGDMVHVSDRAERLIGFSRYLTADPDPLAPDDLFFGSNTLDEIKAMRDRLRAGDGHDA